MIELAPRAALHHARCNAAGVRLPDGRVLIVGGATARGAHAALAASCELYDPAIDRWEPVPRLTIPRQDLAITMLSDGSVVTLGGRGLDRTPLDTVEVWRAGDSAWRRIAPLPRPVWGAQALVVDDQRALIVGGFEASGPTTAVYWLDRRTGAISPAPPTRIAHAHHAVALDAEGRPLAAGPWQERLDGERWRDVGGLFGGDSDAIGLVTLADGTVLLAGGRALDDMEAAVEDSAVLVAGANRFVDAGRFTRGGRWSLTLAAFGDRAVAVGGLTHHRNPRFCSAWEVWSSTTRWQALSSTEPRWLHVQVALADGSYLLVGGAADASGVPSLDATNRVSRLSMQAPS